MKKKTKTAFIKGFEIIMVSDFSKLTLETRKKGSNVFKILKEIILRDYLEFSYPVELSIKYKNNKDNIRHTSP